MELLQNLRAGQAVRRMVGGREFRVAPVTMIVPGVMEGSGGALYYPPEEIAASATAWEGIPIVVNHPPSGSAQEKSYLQTNQVGVVLDPRIENGILRADGWFDVEAVRRVDARILDSLYSAKPIELSTGLYTNREFVGDRYYNGKRYDSIARDYRPDHLAILPDQKGACSIRDGCGVFNQERNDAMCEDNEPMGIPTPDWSRAGETAPVYNWTPPTPVVNQNPAPLRVPVLTRQEQVEDILGLPTPDWTR